MAFAEIEKRPEDANKENPLLKLLLELGPLVIFFWAYNKGDAIAAWAGFPDARPIMAATAVFIPAMAIALLASWRVQGKLPVMPMVSFVLVALFGGMTLYLQDDTFIKMKPTILNLFFAAALMGGLWAGKLFLKVIFAEGWSITDQGWEVLTKRWAIFFVGMAILNEVIWRGFSEEFWVNFKVWGNLPITMIFAAFQFFVVSKYALASERFEKFVFSLAKPDETKSALAALRDGHGVDLPLTVYGLWNGAEGRQLTQDQVELAHTINNDWSAEFAAPLRDIRSRWSAQHAKPAEGEAISTEETPQKLATDALFHAEQEIEKIQLRTLAEHLPDTLETGSEDAMRSNLVALLSRDGRSLDELFATPDFAALLDRAKTVAKLT